MNVWYPVSLIESIEVTIDPGVLVDAFDAGNTTSRFKWGDKVQKRRFRITHAPLRDDEAKRLNGFFQEVNGAYSNFWFRDNPNRRGNANVRWVGQPSPKRNAGAGVRIESSLDEVAAIRQMPELGELETAAGGNTPAIWWDASRETYFPHMWSNYTDPNKTAWDNSRGGLNRPAWYAGGSVPLGNLLAQWQHYAGDGTARAVMASNNADFVGSPPNATLFCLYKAPTISIGQTLFGIGSVNSGMMGIQLDSSNNVAPDDGQTVLPNTCRLANSPINAWNSAAVIYNGGNHTVVLNGTAGSVESLARVYAAGPASLLCRPDSTRIVQTNTLVAHCMAFTAVLSVAQIKAIHNLLAYQYGMATV